MKFWEWEIVIFSISLIIIGILGLCIVALEHYYDIGWERGKAGKPWIEEK